MCIIAILKGIGSVLMIKDVKNKKGEIGAYWIKW